MEEDDEWMRDVQLKRGWERRDDEKEEEKLHNKHVWSKTNLTLLTLTVAVAASIWSALNVFRRSLFTCSASLTICIAWHPEDATTGSLHEDAAASSACA